ncbi:cathepsin L [Sarracenia purpurea var. burkii]
MSIFLEKVDMQACAWSPDSIEACHSTWRSEVSTTRPKAEERPAVKSETKEERMKDFGEPAISLNETIDYVDVKVDVGPLHNYPKEVNWTMRGAVTRVKRVGKCEIHGIFSVVASIESHWFLKTGELVELSEQNLLDCMTFPEDPCSNTQLTRHNAYLNVLENQGIAKEKSYPYEAKKGECRYLPKERGAYISSVKLIRFADENALKHAVATMGPVSITVELFDSLKDYTTGVLYTPECVSFNAPKRLPMLIVGYGTQDGKDYWLAKAALGEEWGEKGYVKMARNRENNCGIANWGYYPTEDELSSSFGVAVIPSSETNDLVENKAHVEVAPDYDIPNEVNWTRRRAVTAVKDEGSCLINEIFTVAASIESHWFLKTGELVDLSVQNIMDCANFTIDPCGTTKNMNMDKMFQYVIENQELQRKSHILMNKRGVNVGITLKKEARTFHP